MLAKRKLSDLYQGKDHADSASDPMVRSITTECEVTFTSVDSWSVSDSDPSRYFPKTSLTELPSKVLVLPSSECTHLQNTVDSVTGKTEIVGYKQIAANDQGTKNDEQLLRFVEKFPTQ